VTKNQRRAAKTVNFGVLYGLSAFGLAKRLNISQEEATAFIDAYFARYPGVTEFQEKVLDAARRDGYVSTILGRRRGVQGLRDRSSYRHRTQPEREALNTVIQGSAADLMKQAMLLIARRLRRDAFPARLLLQIHDELVFEVEHAARGALGDMVAHEMTHALPLKVPLQVDVAAGPNWLDLEPLTVPALIA
jgi:DNA polymerase-1